VQGRFADWKETTLCRQVGDEGWGWGWRGKGRDPNERKYKYQRQEVTGPHQAGMPGVTGVLQPALFFAGLLPCGFDFEGCNLPTHSLNRKVRTDTCYLGRYIHPNYILLSMPTAGT
jgi:hypothetical protein